MKRSRGHGYSSYIPRSLIVDWFKKKRSIISLRNKSLAKQRNGFSLMIVNKKRQSLCTLVEREGKNALFRLFIFFRCINNISKSAKKLYILTAGSLLLVGSENKGRLICIYYKQHLQRRGHSGSWRGVRSTSVPGWRGVKADIHPRENRPPPGDMVRFEAWALVPGCSPSGPTRHLHHSTASSRKSQLMSVAVCENHLVSYSKVHSGAAKMAEREQYTPPVHALSLLVSYAYVNISHCIFTHMYHHVLYASTKLNIFFLWQCLDNIVSSPRWQCHRDNQPSSRGPSVAQIPRLEQR